MPIAGVLCDGGAADAQSAGKYYFSGGQNPAAADQPAAHERQHVLHRAATRRLAPANRQLGRRQGRASADHEVIANVDAISAPELVYPEAVYLHNGEIVLRPRAGPGRQGGLRRAARDGLLHAGRAGKQRA